jgi:hypothetical protein
MLFIALQVSFISVQGDMVLSSSPVAFHKRPAPFRLRPKLTPDVGSMSSETLREFIERREKELRHHEAALEAQLSIIKAELQELAVAKSGVGDAQFAREEKEIFTYAVMDPHATIKELAIQALLDRFPKGAMLNTIRDFIRDAYGRSIAPSSLRTQMHRLKEAGIIGQEPSTDTWNFQDGKRRLYAMYNHPSSRRAMRELRDDPESEPTVVIGLKPSNRPDPD